MPFHVQKLQKAKFAPFYKDTHFSDKWQNVLGNVIHIANLLNSIEDKKL